LYDSKQKQLEEPKFSPCKVPKKAQKIHFFALEKFLKILIKIYLFKSSFLSFLIFSVCCFVAAKTDPRGVHAHFGWISRFPGTLGGFNFIFFLGCPFPSGSWVSWLVFFA
jgi:hypothetical protein